jgi:tetratricopeptide (TPR) repeat protein
MEALLKKALELDPALAEGHASLGLPHGAMLWDWRKAESAFERSIRLNPNYAPARFWNAVLRFTPLGRLEDAAREAERAMELEPLAPIYHGASMMIALWRHQFDLAQVIGRKILELEPDFAVGLCWMAQVLCQVGACEEAVATMERACHLLAPGGFWGPGVLGYCNGRCGRQEEARRILADLETLRERSYAQATALAAVHTGLGEKDRALEWLERAFEEHCGFLAWLRCDSVWDSLREEPRFRALLRRMNLVG